MSARQYIGARYVPRFSDVNNGNWSSVYSYEPLIIVKNGNDYYTSKKSVPVGIAITNTDYWIKTGDYNGAISALDTRVGALETDNTSNIDRISHIEDNYSRDMKDRVFLLMGDSYDVTTSYLTTVGNSIKCKSYTKRSATGAGFVKVGSTLPSYYQILTTLSPLTADEKAKITDVVFSVAVGNDLYSAISDLTDALSQINTYLRANCPKLRNILLCPVGWCTASASVQANMRNTMSVYSHFVPGLGWKYIDCTRVMKSGAYINPDDEMGYHPTSQGGGYIAQCVAEAILTGSVSFETLTAQYPIVYEFTPTPTKGTITHPTEGTLQFIGGICPDGTISLKLNAFPLILENIDLASGNSSIDIDLVPTTPKKIPIPVGLNDFYPLSVFGNSCFRTAGFMQRTEGALKIRIFCYAESALTGQVAQILPNSDWTIH